MHDRLHALLIHIWKFHIVVTILMETVALQMHERILLLIPVQVMRPLNHSDGPTKWLSYSQKRNVLL